MKTIILGIVMLFVVGCGDTVNNTTAAVPATGSTPALPFVNFTGHPPILAGAAPFIPSNTFCTSKMNEVFITDGAPLSIYVSDGPGTSRREWSYETPPLTSKYYFTWSDTQLSFGERCYFDFYHNYIIIP